MDWHIFDILATLDIDANIDQFQVLTFFCAQEKNVEMLIWKKKEILRYEVESEKYDMLKIMKICLDCL